MAITIEKRFQLEAPVGRVFDYMSDPEQVAPCLPGVELVGVVEGGTDVLESTYTGNVRVKVGPMMVAYKGEAQLIERDVAARTFKIVGKGKEKGGAGSAKMQLEAIIEEVDGRAEVAVKATLDLTGKIVRFGRGMIQGVSDQLFEEFVVNVRTNLEQADTDTSRGDVDPGDTRARDEPPESDFPPTLPTGTVPPPPDEPRAESEGDSSAEGGSERAVGSPDASSSAAKSPSSTLATSRSPRSLAPPSEPVSAFSLFFKVLARVIRDFFKRLSGRA